MPGVPPKMALRRRALIQNLERHGGSRTIGAKKWLDELHMLGAYKQWQKDDLPELLWGKVWHRELGGHAFGGGQQPSSWRLLMPWEAYVEVGGQIHQAFLELRAQERKAGRPTGPERIAPLRPPEPSRLPPMEVRQREARKLAQTAPTKIPHDDPLVEKILRSGEVDDDFMLTWG